MSGSMFVINAKGRACPSHYALNPRYETRSGSIQFRLPDENLDALKFGGLYMFALHTVTDFVMTADAFHRCREVDWGRTVARDVFVSYTFETVGVIELEGETVPVNKRGRSSDKAPAYFNLPVVPAHLGSGVSRTIFEALQPGYDKEDSLAENTNEDKVPEAAGGGNLDALLQKDLR